MTGYLSVHAGYQDWLNSIKQRVQSARFCRLAIDFSPGIIMREYSRVGGLR